MNYIYLQVLVSEYILIRLRTLTSARWLNSQNEEKSGVHA